VAIQGQDQPHPAKSLAVDFFTGRLAALADQAGAWHGSRLCRLVVDGVLDCGQSVERSMMLEFYRSDPYLAFAKRVGVAPSSATKETHEPLRDRYKTGLLSIQYGIQADTLGARLGVSTFDAHEMINQHNELFAAYWRWSDDWLAHALDTGVMWTPLGWTCRTGITEFNARSIRNFPIQGAGADILRVACIWANRHGLRLLGPVHDAVLIEAPFERIEADVALMQELMRRASRGGLRC